MSEFKFSFLFGVLQADPWSCKDYSIKTKDIFFIKVKTLPRPP